MGRKVADSVRLQVSVPRQLNRHLEEIVRLGTCGQTVPEVVKTLVGREVERLLGGQMIPVARPARRVQQ